MVWGGIALSLLMAINDQKIQGRQQDNATSHVARVNIQYLQNHNVDFIDDWPSKSPDLNGNDPIPYLI